VIDGKTLRKIANAGPLVVSDEVYREIWYDAPPGRCLDCRTTSSSSRHVEEPRHDGLRLGWAIAAESVMKPIITAHQYIATCASAFSQSLAEAILMRRDWNRSWLEGIARSSESSGKSACRHRARARSHITPPAGAFYAFVPVPRATPSHSRKRSPPMPRAGHPRRIRLARRRLRAHFVCSIARRHQLRIGQIGRCFVRPDDETQQRPKLATASPRIQYHSRRNEVEVENPTMKNCR